MGYGAFIDSVAERLRKVARQAKVCPEAKLLAHRRSMAIETLDSLENFYTFKIEGILLKLSERREI
jgi:hypothetical protein